MADRMVVVASHRADDTDGRDVGMAYSQKNAELVKMDTLGSVRTKDGLFEAICWEHRGMGWDVHGTTTDVGTHARTQTEAYALLRKMHRAYWGNERRRENNDSRCWT